jgi:hypothetical protein
MKLLPIAGGKFVKVDDDVYEWANKMSWSFNKDGYAKAWSPNKKKHVYLHREIMGNPKGMVDHKSGDPSDNRRENLRASTNSQNQMNSRGKPHSSIYKNVYWNKKQKKWKAQIRVDGQDFFIGYFAKERHAALAADLNLPILHGEHARLNFASATNAVF